MTEWISFDHSNPQTGIPILIKLRDGRILKGSKIHTELHFDDIASGDLKADHWETQLEALSWKYNK